MEMLVSTRRKKLQLHNKKFFFKNTGGLLSGLKGTPLHPFGPKLLTHLVIPYLMKKKEPWKNRVKKQGHFELSNSQCTSKNWNTVVWYSDLEKVHECQMV
jgi:hypothetical protein